MKKRQFILTFALLMVLSNALAENKLLIKDAYATLNGKTALAIDVVIEKDNFVGYQFDITLPKELLLSLNDAGKVIASSYTDLDIDGNVYSSTETTTTYRIIASKMGNPTIPTGTYTLLSLTMETDGSLAVDDVEACTVSDITFSDNTNHGTDFENVNFNVSITDRVILDENSTVVPAAQNGVNVLVRRTIKAGHWNTIVLPFALRKAQAEAAFGENAVYYKFTGFQTDVDFDELKPTAIVMNFTQYKFQNALSALTGGQPFLVITNKNIDEFTVDNVKIIDAVSPTNVTDDEYGFGGKFMGTFVVTKIPEDGLFISNNQFWYSTGNTTIKAFRAWFDLDVVLNRAIDLSRITLNFIDDESTGIQDNNRETINNSSYYDLQGRRVNTPTKKGLYIRNGRKEVVK